MNLCTVFVVLALVALASSDSLRPPRKHKKATKVRADQDETVDPADCEVANFDCTRANIKRCKKAKSPNIEQIKQYCFAIKGHKDMLKELQDVFDGEMQKTRTPRRLEQLTEGHVEEVNFDEAGSCNIGGGTISSFDGYSHTLTGGPCTYVLTVDRTVTKLVVYGTFDSYNGGKFANRLKNVAIYMERNTLVLGESFDINYQGLGYDAPAVINDELVVWRDEHYIYAEAKDIQARIRWDPIGQLKISVGPEYRNNVLGLCGLFNNDTSVEQEHNSIRDNYGSADMTTNEYATEWALSGCYHEDVGRLAERNRNCDTYLYSRLCSVTHSAPELINCLRDEEIGEMYRQECVRNLCLCDDIDACLYSETLRISNDCYDRLGEKIDNEALRTYLNEDFIQNVIPVNYAEVPTGPLPSEGPDNIEFGQPYQYQDFAPGAACYVYGHSHVHTFDGVSYRTGAHGCTYPLSLKEGIQQYAIYGTFAAEQPSGNLASSLLYISFFDLKNRIRVQLGQGLEVNYEGKAVNMPYHREFVSIWHDSARHQVYIYDHDLGLEVRWDGESALRIRLDSKYRDTTKGLCGTFNNDGSDDINLLRETVNVPTSYQVMVQEWELPTCSFKEADYVSPDVCRPSLVDYSTCKEALTNVKFSFCVTDLPAVHFIERCEQDLCRCGDDEACKCEIVSAYAQMCQDVIGTELSWRDEEFCPLNMCLFAKNGCQHTCTPPGVCECDQGFELGADGKSCLVIIEV